MGLKLVSAKSEDGERTPSKAEPAQSCLNKERPGITSAAFLCSTFKSEQRRFRTSGFVRFSL